MSTKFICSLVGFTASVFAQVASPNEAGVAFGHIHLYVHDLDRQQRFWTQLGGTSVGSRIEFPGGYVILRQQEPTGGTVGSVIDHIGFKVKDLNALLPKLTAMSVKIERGTTPASRFITAPDDIKLEISEDRSMRTLVALDHIHMFLPDPKAAQAWYAKNFGAIAGERASGSGLLQTATVPGGEITITKKNGLLAPTTGRSVEHIGFEISNLDQFVRKLEAAGIRTEMGVHKASNSDMRIAHITDPWGTRIELTEGLRSIPVESVRP